MPVTQDQLDIITAMRQEIADGPEIYRPSEYWRHLNEKHIDQLRLHGFENFKRTINQNGFDWIPTDSGNNQLALLEKSVEANPPDQDFDVDYAAAEEIEAELGVRGPDESDALWARYARFVALLWYFTDKTDARGLLSTLSEPEVGNPIYLFVYGKRISQDLSNSVRETNAILDYVDNDTVAAELGAGHGRLAYVFGAATHCRYLIFDILPDLYVSQWYLGQVYPDRRIVGFRHFDRFEQVAGELEASDFAFFTPNQLALFPPMKRSWGLGRWIRR